MIKTKYPITAINGFNIGDKVRLKDGDGREHIIKSFSIEGLNEFFFEVQFEDGSWAMLDNIELLHFDLDLVAMKYAIRKKMAEEMELGEEIPMGAFFLAEDAFKSGAEWMAKQGVCADATVRKLLDNAWISPLNEKQFEADIIDHFDTEDKVIVQIRKK